jgi:hypothetical protein
MDAVRAFNEAGIQRFREYLKEIKESKKHDIDKDLLFNDEYSYTVGDIEIRPSSFESKLEAAEYLYEIIQKITIKDKFYNVGLWTWLAAYYFDSICPIRPNGTRKVKKEYYYILPAAREWKTQYRHLLAGPVRIYTFHGPYAKILLFGSVDVEGEFTEQVASRKDIVVNKGIISALIDLYWDETTHRPIRGCAPNKKTAGTLRRFLDVIQQFDLTYDLFSMSGKQIMNLLPQEFAEYIFHQ